MRWGALTWAVIGIVAVVAWVMTGDGIIARPYKPVALTNVVGGQDKARVHRVRVAESRAQLYRSALHVQGTTEASRKVVVRSESEGRVSEQPVEKGQQVAAGTLLARLPLDGADVRLREMKALVEQRRLEYAAARKLHKQGYRSQTQLAEALAKLEGARAARHRAEKAISNTRIFAPFSGVLVERHIEVGDYLKKGDPVATLADLDTILVTGTVGERDRTDLHAGQSATARLLNGREIHGQVKFISMVADPHTRTYRIEVALPNPDRRLFDGQSAELRVAVDAVSAHQLPASVLTLNPQGQLGVKHLAPDDKVLFQAVDVLAQTPGGVWVKGLPKQARVIVVGQERVEAGDGVTAEHTGFLRTAATR